MFRLTCEILLRSCCCLSRATLRTAPGAESFCFWPRATFVLLLLSPFVFLSSSSCLIRLLLLIPVPVISLRSFWIHAGLRGVPPPQTKNKAAGTNGTAATYRVAATYGIAATRGVAATCGIETTRGIAATHGIAVTSGIAATHGIPATFGVAAKNGIAESHGVGTPGLLLKGRGARVGRKHPNRRHSPHWRSG